MQAGEIVKVDRNAQLLNKLLGTDYKQWYKSTYQLTADTMIWIIRLDNKLRNGWRNKSTSDRIIEGFDGNTRPSNIYLGMQVKKRVVFEKVSGGYVFHGVYQYDASRSNLTHRELVKLSDTYTF